MQRIFFISIVLLGICLGVTAQSMIGLTKEEVANKVKKEHRDFHKDDSVIRQRFNYLKYVNGLRTKTWIIYFDEHDIARTSKLICDYSDFEDEVRDIQENHRQTGEYTWEYKSGMDTILVEVSKQEWYFTIRETSKQ
jgi:hypothetical protein